MTKKIIFSILLTFALIFLSTNSMFIIQKIIDIRVPYIVGFSVFTEMWDDGYFRAEGSWNIDYSSEKDYSLPNISIIKCDKESGYCTEAHVFISRPKIDFPICLSLKEYAIEKWDNRNIIYIENIKGIGGTCGRRIVTIDRETKSITAAYNKLRDVPKNMFSYPIDPHQRDSFVDPWEMCKKFEKEAFPITLAWSFGIFYFFGYFYFIYRIWRIKLNQ